MDPEVEQRRREELVRINAEAGDRATLMARHGQVWDTEELQREFEPLQFAAPFLLVRRKSDRKRGTVQFQHQPRFYWGWEEHHE